MKNQTKHTAGPWEVYGETGTGRDGTPVYGIGFGLSGQLGEIVGNKNAALVAAAPELLEACQNSLAILKTFRDSGQYNIPRHIVNLEQAIAKAEGMAL